MFNDMTNYNDDYPKEPIGGSNPYYCCSFCKRSVPEINGDIKKHAQYCEWRIEQEKESNQQQSFLPSIQKLLNKYEQEGKPHLRLGQYFVGYYIKYSWPELFYEENQEKAIKAISVYLEHLQYINELPQKVR